jgi:hypothetical protein
MPTVLVNAILARASALLQDGSHIRWPLAELLDWLNDGQRDVVLHKPNAYVLNTALHLVAGTRQSLPLDGVQLLDIVRNVPGLAVRLVLREILDAQLPNWHGENAASLVKHYCYADRDLKHFYVYPPNTGTGVVELIYSAAPPDAAQGGVIAVDDIYQSVLLDYILYRAYSKDTEYTADPARAASHYTAFANALGGKLKMEIGASPNTTAEGNPNMPRR